MEVQKIDFDMTENSEMAFEVEANYTKKIEDLSQQLNTSIRERAEESEMFASNTEQLSRAKQVQWSDSIVRMYSKISL